MSEEDFNVELAHIVVNEPNPFKLFDEWFQDVKDTLHFVQLRLMNVATVSKEGRVSNRSVLLQGVEEDGFIFNTDRHGRKSQEIKDHPQMAATIVWNYEKDGKWIQRQTRIEGNAVILDASYAQKQFDSAPLNHKIRNMLCNQGDVTDWNALNERFGQLMEDVKTNKKPIELTENLVVYKIVPDRVEFYDTYTNAIADRVVFTKEEDQWSVNHVEA